MASADPTVLAGPLRLRWTAVDGTLTERELSPGAALTIGRAPACDIAIEDATMSRSHARLVVGLNEVTIEDLGSRNGTLVNGQRVARSELRIGDRLLLGQRGFELVQQGSETLRLAISSEGRTVVEMRPGPAATVVAAPVDVPAELGVVPESLLRQAVISEADLIAAGVDVTVVPVLALGSGMGSFVFADALRNSGMHASDITVVGNEPTPYGRYQRLCNNSQIPPHERLRSNSKSCPDNTWGFPGYAVREMWGNLRRGDVRTTASVLWSLFGESAIADTYTPRSGDVFANMAREANRVGWDQMLRFGRIRTIRKTTEGRILAIASASDETQRRHYAVSARWVHLSLGYPAIQLLPDLAEYRERTNDRRHVVNAYEPHPHIYEQLRKQGGTVILRGRGIVASRVLQRLYEERQTNKNITVVHLHRSRLQSGRRYGWSQRKVDGEFEFQAFNWPKGCWTGPQRYALEAADPEERKRLLDLWGGTTTANRSDWRRIVRGGIQSGWYRQEYGVVKAVTPAGDRVMTTIENSLAGGGKMDLAADFVIDCTGLVASPERAPVLDDLIETYGLERNPLGRFRVSNDFEVVGMRHGNARLFAAGATTLGGPFATVDSFLGLQYAALRAINAMADDSPPALHRLTGWYSFQQWLKWARKVAP